MPRLQLKLISSAELRERLERALRANEFVTTAGQPAEEGDSPSPTDPADSVLPDPDPPAQR